MLLINFLEFWPLWIVHHNLIRWKNMIKMAPLQIIENFLLNFEASFFFSNYQPTKTSYYEETITQPKKSIRLPPCPLSGLGNGVCVQLLSGLLHRADPLLQHHRCHQPFCGDNLSWNKLFKPLGRIYRTRGKHQLAILGLL